MRRAVIVLGLLPAFVAPAGAEPIAAPGYRVEALEHDLILPSGAARDRDALILTDLLTGKVVRRRPEGTSEVLHEGLPVGKDVMDQPTGPYKVQVLDGRIFVAQGWQDVNRHEGPLDHAILEIAPGQPPRVVGNDFWNPYDFEWDGRAWYVADAARNTLMRLNLSGQAVEVFAFPRLRRRRDALRALSPTEFQGAEVYELDAVPSGVAVAGARVFVALFGGFPFLDGGGLVVSLPKTGGVDRARIEVKGLNAPTDIAFDRTGNLLVLEIGRYALGKGFLPGSGRLLEGDLEDGRRQALMTGLPRPVRVVTDADGALV
ncbi:MAG: ScyD/ScyE family protein, partial [Kiloniellaceae bacterium]